VTGGRQDGRGDNRRLWHQVHRARGRPAQDQILGRLLQSFSSAELSVDQLESLEKLGLNVFKARELLHFLLSDPVAIRFEVTVLAFQPRYLLLQRLVLNLRLFKL
jgi:glutamine synthetase adenylyltransferase